MRHTQAEVHPMSPALKLAAAGGVLALMTFGQNPDARFLAADVHVSPKTQNQFLRPPTTRGEVYEIKNATMADLIGFAYNSNTSKVVGGPSWLEMDRFDVVAKLPSQTAPDVQQKMLQALLAERFQLVVKEEIRPFPTYALVDGKNRKIKEADGSGETGCRPQSSSAPAGAGTLRLSMASPDGGAPIQISLEGGMVEYKCRNMTMAAFASGLRAMVGASVGVNPVVDQTGLTGTWNFDLKYSIGLIGLPGMGTGETVTIFDAVEKQLGLKLEEKQVPTPVIAVVSVNPKPTENPPGTADALPNTLLPTEFEVASIKPTSPDSKRTTFQTQAGGRVVSEGLPLTFWLSRAFNQSFTGQIVGTPSWADSARFDLMAVVSSDGSQPVLDTDTIGSLMLNLLKERFKLAYHVEQRELPAYDLVADKPKMKKADPAARSWCKAPNQVPGAAPAPQGSQAMICQNITMGQFAELLRGRVPGLEHPTLNLTGLEGGWDFRLTYNLLASLPTALAARAPAEGGAAPSPMSAASEPTVGYTFFEAIEKQLGLKLEKAKRSVAVTVIDHLEQTPTEN